MPTLTLILWNLEINKNKKKKGLILWDRGFVNLAHYVVGWDWCTADAHRQCYHHYFCLCIIAFWYIFICTDTFPITLFCRNPMGLIISLFFGPSLIPLPRALSIPFHGLLLNSNQAHNKNQGLNLNNTDPNTQFV